MQTILIEAAVFDLDGVITDTAAVHAQAWKMMFDEFRKQSGSDFPPMVIEQDYTAYIDGKPRYEGVRSFLASRNIELQEGSPEDKAGIHTVCGLGNRKNEIFQEMLAGNSVEVFGDAIKKLKQWREAGIKTAVVSSSKNCKQILEIAGIRELFDVRVDGITREDLQLHGKPHPDIFLEAVRRLQISPKQAVVFEDAIAGVEAGKKGGFCWVVGVERKGMDKELKSHGADQVICSFDDIELQKPQQPGKLPFSRLPSALEHYEEIKNRLGNKKLALFLDYDGTLSPIVPDPDKALLAADMKEILEKLARRCTLAIISGRDLEDVKSKVDMPGLYFAGSHGLDISGPDMQNRVGEDALPRIEEAEKEIQKLIDETSGSRLERKKLVIAAHYRNAADEEGRKLKKNIEKIVENYPELRITENKKVIEVRPDVEWDKGKAIEYLLETLELHEEEVLPVFLGDDVTDEDGFRDLARKGVGIVVGDHGQPSFARYRLEDPDEVKKFLHQLSDILLHNAADHWKIVYEDYVPEDEPLREALCTLGNGYFASRGAAEETVDEGVHYPGTYVAGGYNRAETEIAGKIIENEDLVNWPNWLPLTFRINGGDWFHIDEVEVLSYQQILDLKTGVLERNIQFRDSSEQETSLVCRRLVSQRNPHLAGIQWQLCPKNWSGTVEIRSALDGRVTNNGVERYSELNGNHLRQEGNGKEGEHGMYLLASTRRSRILMAQAARTEVSSEGRLVAAERETHTEEGYIEQIIRFEAEKLKSVQVEKIVALYTSADLAIAEPELEARKAIMRAESFDELCEAQKGAWAELWRRFDIVIEDHLKDQMVLRLHLFHLLQTVSLNTIDLDVGVPSRGWHGEAYRGHIFWDEIFIFPLINLRVPELTRSLLMYRYRRLGEARAYARQYHYKGAMFPWQSGSNGKEESQQIHLNPQSGQWLPDYTYLQRHISADIVFNIIQYYEATGDKEFMNFYGAEIILEVAHFFSSLATWSEEKKRYEINCIVGPDEYHTQYPGSEKPGINNNAYTNIMAAWVLTTALEIVEELEECRHEELLKNLQINEEDLIRWEKVSKQMFVPFLNDRVINQFEGYENLKELDWETYRSKYGDFLRLDRILQAEDDDVNRYKASKQADVLMLFYLFTDEELKEIFSRLDYSFEPEMIEDNIAYYEQRTSHGSTLSQLVYSWILARSDRKRSWQSFQKALMSDFSDVQGGTTPEGIHLGAMAGTVDLMQRCYTGISISKNILRIDPQLPENLNKITCRIKYRGCWLNIDVDHQEIRIRAEKGAGEEIKLSVRAKVFSLRAGDEKTVLLS